MVFSTKIYSPLISTHTLILIANDLKSRFPLRSSKTYFDSIGTINCLLHSEIIERFPLMRRTRSTELWTKLFAFLETSSEHITHCEQQTMQSAYNLSTAKNFITIGHGYQYICTEHLWTRTVSGLFLKDGVKLEWLFVRILPKFRMSQRLSTC